MMKKEVFVVVSPRGEIDERSARETIKEAICEAVRPSLQLHAQRSPMSHLTEVGIEWEKYKKEGWRLAVANLEVLIFSDDVVIK